MFYPGDPDVLRREIKVMLGAAGARKGFAGILGVVAPHAGYQYSGSTAAAGYARLAGSRYPTVVVLAPSHREYFDGASVYPGDAYETPLGRIPVNADLRRRLLEQTPLVTASVEGHRAEHAIEVQLPFLQSVLGDFSLLPIVLGNQRRDFCFELGGALAAVLRGEGGLIVASTDLSHYHPALVARKLDQVFVDDVKRLDPERLMDHLEHGATEACGGGPVVSFLCALGALGASHLEITRQSTSGDVTGDTSAVVGYVSAVAYA
jgi:hypothetical protein